MPLIFDFVIFDALSRSALSERLCISPPLILIVSCKRAQVLKGK